MTGSSESQGKAARAGLWLVSNGPALVTVVASALIAILAGVLDLSTEELLQVVLALLALMGTSLLTERLIEGRRDRATMSKIGEQVDELLSDSLSMQEISLDEIVKSRRDLGPLEERLSRASRVSISGGSLLRLVNEYQSFFEQLATAGCSLRFVMTLPSSDGAQFLSEEVSYESQSLDAYRGHMEDSANALKRLAGMHPNSCEVRYFDGAPPFSLIVVERSEETIVQVELYTLGLPARDRPILVCSSENEPVLCGLFTEQFEALWRSPRTGQIS